MRARSALWLVTGFAALLLVPAFVRGQGQPAPAAPTLAQRVDAAVARGVQYLATLQTKDGSLTSDFQGRPGETALALLAMLRAGADPNDKAIDQGFVWLSRQSLQQTYDVALLLMALEARYTPPENVIRERNLERTTVVQRVFQGLAPPKDQDLARKAVDWLVANRTKGKKVWRYPSPDSVDNSATQFAVLGLHAGHNLGVEAPPEVFVDVLEYFVATQEESGPEVQPFPVPAAEGRIKRPPAAGRPGGAGGAKNPPPSRGSQTRPPEETDDNRVSEAPRVFQARGWGYTPPEKPQGETPPGTPPPAMVVSPATGAMTAAGTCSLVIAKSMLEDVPGFAQRYGRDTDRAIRDGAAWLAQNFTVTGNPPSSGGWHIYYLYGLERVGMLAGTARIGTHDWYAEGAEQLLSMQRPDGSWNQDSEYELCSTAFAILFLTRATPPVLSDPPPRRPTTGEGRMGQSQGSSTGSTTGGQ